MDRRLLLDIPDLPPEAFKHIGDKRIKPEGGGGKGGGSSTTTVQQSVPPELVPYVREVIQEGQKVAALPYVPYQGTRIAQFAPEQQAVQSQVMGLRTPQQYQTAMAGAQGTGALGFGAAQQGLQGGIEGARGTGALGFSTAQQGLGKALGYTPGTFSQREAGYYMSPYQQNVTDIALREAQRAADIEGRNIGLRSVGRGTSGGSAEALQRAELARNLMTQRGDIQARGSEAAFLQAQQQFERDRAAAAGAAGLGAQVGTSGLGTAGQMAGTLGQIGQGGLGTSLQSALGLGELAGASQRADLARLEAQRQIGSEIQARQQRILDQQYQDFLAQRGYPREQLAFYSDIVRGNAPLFGTVQQTTQPLPGVGQQILGYGLGALGAYKALA
jgi:hypothetical protein